MAQLVSPGKTYTCRAEGLDSSRRVVRTVEATAHDLRDVAEAFRLAGVEVCKIRHVAQVRLTATRGGVTEIAVTEEAGAFGGAQAQSAQLDGQTKLDVKPPEPVVPPEPGLEMPHGEALGRMPEPPWADAVRDHLRAVVADAILCAIDVTPP